MSDEKQIVVAKKILLILALISFLIGVPTLAFGGILFVLLGMIELSMSLMYAYKERQTERQKQQAERVRIWAEEQEKKQNQ